MKFEVAVPSLIFIACLAGCSNGSPSSSSGTSGTSGSTSGSYTGTWDIGSDMATGSGAVLVLQPDALKFTAGKEELSYASVQGKLEVSYTKSSRVTAFTAARTASVVSLGALGLDLGGDWTFAGVKRPDHQCKLNAQASAFTASCNETFGWPRQIPQPDDDRVYTATRVKQLTSVFGDLGGEWQLTDALSKEGQCTLTFSDSTVTSLCTNVQGLTGTMTLVLKDDGSAAGNTSTGATLSGRKR